MEKWTKTLRTKSKKMMETLTHRRRNGHKDMEPQRQTRKKGHKTLKKEKEIVYGDSRTKKEKWT